MHTNERRHDDPEQPERHGVRRGWRAGIWRRLIGQVVDPVIRCRDEFGRRCTLTVQRNADGVVFVPSRPGPLQVEPLEIGRMRGTLRDAILQRAAPGEPTTRAN